MKLTISRWAATLWFAFVSALSCSASAQTYPVKPVRIVVPYSAGSGTDTISRIVADGLAEHLKQPVIVENRDGAGGVVGTVAVKNSPADGYTLVTITNTLLINGAMYRKPPYDAMNDFVHLARVTYNPLALMVSAQSPYKTFKDLIDYMKANPNKLSFATSGKGAQSQLEVEYIKGLFGARAIDIPYKSTATAIADTITGTVAFYMTGFSAAWSNIQGGRLRALAVGSPQREPAAPDVPTFIEVTGVPGYLPAAWFGFSVVAGTPQEAVTTLEAGILKAIAAPAAQEKVLKMNSKLWVQGSRELTADMRAENEKWVKLINDLNLKTD
jgi:tripartite-type tricarboxylate transporter receptor subunit TctC